MVFPLKNFVAILALLLLAGCSGGKVDPTEDMSAAELYFKAREYMTSETYTQAIEHYEILESRYPFGDYAVQAKLDVAYAYYLYNEPESATAAADRFIKLHPRHPAVDYAYYIKGLINFGLKSSIVDTFYSRDLADYDPSIMQQSYEDFSILVNRFPDSEYSRDARKRMVFLRNQMARSEIKIAKHYLSRRAWVAAANRAKYLLQRFQGSDSVVTALQIQMLAYEQLELTDLAADTRRVLVLNYGEQAATITLEEMIS